MLISWGTLRIPCPQGENVAELIVVGKTVVQLASGKRYDDVWGGRFVEGAPFGNDIKEASAPIDLLPSDEIALIQPDGEVFMVFRGGKQIWPEEEIPFIEPEPKPGVVKPGEPQPAKRRGAAVPRQRHPVKGA